MLKMIRKEVVTYYIDEETGVMTKKVTESRLISESNGEERWDTNSRVIPLV